MTDAVLLTFGEAMLRLSPTTGGTLTNSPTLDFGVGGAELNVAIAASRMGLPTRWMTRLPDNVLGDRIITHARTNGVEPIVARGDERVGAYFIEIGSEPRGVTVTYDRDHSAARKMSPADFDVPSLLSEATAVFTSGITLALGEGPRALAASMYASGNGCRRYFEINHRSKLASLEQTKAWVEPLLPNVDVLFASPHDLNEMLGLGDDPEKAAEKALANYGCEYVVVSQREGRVGGMGMNSIRVVGRDVHAYAECEGRIVDPIGAGDAGAGVMIACLEEGIDPHTAAEFAVCASAWVQTHPGDSATFRREEIVSRDSRRVRR